ncbi:MAG: hypothetical protein QXO93_01845 [Acidilobaceae archaeon]
MRPSWGTIIIIDLDRFSEFIESRGLNPYSPNDVTGELSRLIDIFKSKHSAIVIYGLDWDRGTEEAIIEIPEVEAESLIEDLKDIAKTINSLGASATIVALTGYILGKEARNRREAYKGDIRRKAKRILEKLKRRGGNLLYVDGLIYKVGEF